MAGIASDEKQLRARWLYQWDYLSQQQRGQNDTPARYQQGRKSHRRMRRPAHRDGFQKNEQLTAANLSLA